MRRLALQVMVAIVTVVLVGCSAPAEDAGETASARDPADALPPDGTTTDLPTELPTAAAGNTTSTTGGPVTPGDPLAGLDPCDLLTDEEAARFELVAGQHDESLCTWTYTGASDKTVFMTVAFQRRHGIDKLVAEGHTRVPTFGNHKAAIGIVSAPGGKNCRVTVGIDDSTVVQIGTVVIGEVSGPDDPVCFGLANPVAQAIEPKLPVVDAPAASAGSG